MWLGMVSLFPQLFSALKEGVTGRGFNLDLLTLHCFNPRDFVNTKYKSVDDAPYGGGPGLLMMAAPLKAALDTAKNHAPCPSKVIYLSPQGQLFTQTAAKQLAKEKALIFVSGRYEGVDERFIQSEIDEEWSIGDYILTGGELAAMVMVDAIARFIPGVVGETDSVTKDSLSQGLLKYPQYTRPKEGVPSLLRGGNHAEIEEWQLKQSLGQTWLKRPDLLGGKTLSKTELRLLYEFIEDFHHAR